MKLLLLLRQQQRRRPVRTTASRTRATDVFRSRFVFVCLFVLATVYRNLSLDMYTSFRSHADNLQ